MVSERGPPGAAFRPRLLVWLAGSLRGSGAPAGAGSPPARPGGWLVLGLAWLWGRAGLAPAAGRRSPWSSRRALADADTGTGSAVLSSLSWSSVTSASRAFFAASRASCCGNGVPIADCARVISWRWRSMTACCSGAELVQSAEPVFQPGHQADAAGELAVVQPDDSSGQVAPAAGRCCPRARHGPGRRRAGIRRSSRRSWSGTFRRGRVRGPRGGRR